MTEGTLMVKDPKPGKTPIYIDGRKYHPERDA